MRQNVFSANLWKIGKLMYPCNFHMNLIQSGGILEFETKTFVICEIVDLTILELYLDDLESFTLFLENF